MATIGHYKFKDQIFFERMFTSKFHSKDKTFSLIKWNKTGEIKCRKSDIEKLLNGIKNFMDVTTENRNEKKNILEAFTGIPDSIKHATNGLTEIPNRIK